MKIFPGIKFHIFNEVLFSVKVLWFWLWRKDNVSVISITNYWNHDADTLNNNKVHKIWVFIVQLIGN